jgi:protein phosphatase
VACREVRLGYALYREALQHSGSGSLVQALGMSKSGSLHPTSQRFIVDEDAVFLLTSDGLSDFDRVEECWDTEILPILTGETNIEDVAPRLIEIANTKNGHDNVTIALVHYQVRYNEPEIKIKAEIPNISTSKTVNLTPASTNETVWENSQQQTQVISEVKPNRAVKLPLQLLILLAVLLAAGSLGYWLQIQRKLQDSINPTTSPSINPQPTLTATPIVPVNPETPANSLPSTTNP